MKQIILLAALLISGAAGAQDFEIIDDTPVGTLDTAKVQALVSISGTEKVFAKTLYSVSIRRQYVDRDPFSKCVNCPNYWEVIKYLDERKKPVKNLIVWVVR